MSEQLYQMNESEAVKCPYRGKDRIHVFDPPLTHGLVVLKQVPIATCVHPKKIKNDCILYEGNVEDCGWISESKAMIAACVCRDKCKVCDVCKKIIVEGEIK
jgi:hypothetical protein